MTTAATPARFLTPPQVARLYVTAPETVIGWIRAGELRAINVARRGATRPRYRIAPADLAVFEAGRTVTALPKSPQRRRQRDKDVIAFF